MMELIIKPVDVWLFRDGKPFFAGNDHEAATIFPPTPFTLQGAIRTKVLVDKGVDLSQFKSSDPDVGYGDNFGKLKLIGPMLVRKTNDDKWERLIPMPADVLKVGDDFELLKPQSLPFKTNLPSGLQLLWAKGQVKEVKGWLPESEWQRYLQGETPKQVLSDAEIFEFEPRVGIAIDRGKRTTQTRMLYRVNFVRLKEKTALWAKVEGVSFQSQNGFLRFGGEGRSAIYEKIEPLQSFKNYIPDLENRFKVLLISPAWFSGGWKPANGDWSKIFGKPVKLVAVALHRPQKIGGFDIAKGEPKPKRNFVSAGSVYFFESEERIEFEEDFAFTETPEEIKKLNDGENAWAKIGLGKVLFGVW